MDLIITAISTGVVCIALLLGLIWMAPTIGLLDQPNQRKQHTAATPVVGGIAIYCAVFVAWIATSSQSGDWLLACWFGLVLIIGVLDDLYDVSYLIRIGSHAAVVACLFIVEDLGVNSIGAVLGGTADVTFFGISALIFTAIGVIGAINSMNMIDGLDGLLGSLCLSSILLLVIISALNGQLSGHTFPPATTAAIVGALAGFLLLNSRLLGNKTAFVFLGDAGSTLLGFLLVYLLIDYSQGSQATISPVLAGWILGLPLLDASAVIASRLFDGKSPFQPDRTHLHHLLQDMGLSVNKTVLSLLALHVTIMICGVFISYTAEAHGDFILFWGFIVLVILRLIVTSNRWAWASIKRIIHSARKPAGTNVLQEERDALGN